MGEIDVVLTVIDVAARAREIFGVEGARRLFPGMSDQDWRFHVQTSHGMTITYATSSTATEVAESLKREGLLDRLPKEE